MATIFGVYIANALTTLGLTDLIPIGQTPASPADGAISYEDLRAQLRDEIATQNLLINGDMSIDQRNSGASQTITAAAAKAYTVDRWYAYCAGANVTGQRVAGSGQSQYRYRFTGAASVSAIQYGQRITQANSYHLNGQTVTLAVDLANSLLTTVTWTAYYATTADTFGTIASPTRTQIATGTFTVNSTVTRYSTQISVPSAATTGIEIVFSVGAQTSGTWTIGDAQLEIGSVASDFERRSELSVLTDCVQHFEVFGGRVAYERYPVGQVHSATGATIHLACNKKYATPSISFSSAAHWAVSPAGGGIIAATNLGAGNIANTTFSIAVTVAGGLVAGNATLFFANNTLSARIYIESEL